MLRNRGHIPYDSRSSPLGNCTRPANPVKATQPLQELEMENDPLKRLLAEATPHNPAPKDLLPKIW